MTQQNSEASFGLQESDFVDAKAVNQATMANIDAKVENPQHSKTLELPYITQADNRYYQFSVFTSRPALKPQSRGLGKRPLSEPSTPNTELGSRQSSAKVSRQGFQMNSSKRELTASLLLPIPRQKPRR